jgi:general secretion pathway protein G
VAVARLCKAKECGRTSEVSNRLMITKRNPNGIELRQPRFESKEPLCLSPAMRPTSTHNPGFRDDLGFTLIELMMVISLMTIMLAIAIPVYSRSIVAARERTLRSDLAILRQDIWKYTLDKQKAPQSLDDLRAARYIEKIPDDPMTHEPNWEVTQEEVLLSPDQQDPGITDVHSASNALSSDGTAYSTW